MVGVIVQAACLIAATSPDPKSRVVAIDALGSATKATICDAFRTLDPIHDENDRAALGDALNSPSRQVRQFAMMQLISVNGEPSQRLLDVCLEALDDDTIPVDTKRPMAQRNWTPEGNACNAAEYLVAHASRVEKEIDKGLESKDWQHRLLCAFIAGRGGLAKLMPKAAPILIEHLKDNDIRGDAATAMSGLYGFGNTILPHLRAMSKPDAQQLLARDVLELRFAADSDKTFEAALTTYDREHPDANDASPLVAGLRTARPKLKWKATDFDERRYLYNPPPSDTPSPESSDSK